MRRALAAGRRAIRPLRTPSGFVLLLLFLVLAAVFFHICHVLGGSRQAPGNGTYARLVARGDGHYYYLGTRSLFIDHDLDIRNDAARFGDPFSTRPTVTGRKYAYPIGPSLLFLPGFALAQGLAEIDDHLLGGHIALHGYTTFHQTITYFVGSLVPGFLCILLLFMEARRRVGERIALFAALGIALATPLFFYTCLWPSYNHAQAAFLVTLLLVYALRTWGRTDLRRLAVLGALAGLAALSREQEALWALLPGADVAVVLARRLRDRRFREASMIALGGVVFFACFAAVFSPQVWYNEAFAGGLFKTPQGSHYLRWGEPQALNVLFSAHNGLFTWTPIALLCVAGVLAAPRRHRVVALGLLACAALQVYIDSSALDWSGNWGMGQRRLTDCILVFGLGLAFLIQRARNLCRAHPRLLPAVAVAGALFPFVLLNVEQSFAVAEGKQSVAGRDCSDALFTTQVDRMVESFYADFGNPAQWPVAIPLAIRHHESLSTIDRLLLNPLLGDYDWHSDRPVRSVVRMSPANLAHFGADGWTAAGGFRAWMGAHGRFVLPLSTGRSQVWTLHGRANLADGATARQVRVLVNGTYVGAVSFRKGWSSVDLQIPDGLAGVGLNDVDMIADAAPPLAKEHLHAASVMLDAITLQTSRY